MHVWHRFQLEKRLYLCREILILFVMKNLPIGVQSFEKLRNKDYLYVDKTKIIHEIILSGDIYFLSRPRRFGKS
jgi:hypothetical protein